MKAQNHRSNEETPRTTLIRYHNDLLRQHGFGGSTVITSGIDALPTETKIAILTAVQSFAGFTKDNDPHGEHDASSLTVRGHDIIFKIDYYNKERTGYSPDPASSTLTCRILTIMLASEY